jgi:hypothetical protein
MTRRTAFLLVLLAVSGCGPTSSPIAPVATTPTATMSAAVTNHLNQLISIMQASSINRLKIDWTALRTTVFSEAGAAQAIPELYPAIRTALRLLGDGHSSYTGANGQTLFVPNRSCSGSGAGTPALPATIGYVRVTSFSGSGSTAVTFADGVQNAIIAADRDEVVGWIVDLRGNGGGNMWPMVAGVGPVLGEGIIGYFIKRPNTRTFGVATCGLSTANRAFPLSDGANLNLTVSVMADRARTRYGDQVVPDEVIADQAQVIARAVAWLSQ